MSKLPKYGCYSGSCLPLFRPMASHCRCEGQQLLRTHNARSSGSFSSTSGSSGKWPVPFSNWSSLVYILEPGDGKREFVMGTKPAAGDPFEESTADCSFFNWDFKHMIRPLFHFGKWKDADSVSFRKE